MIAFSPRSLCFRVFRGFFCPFDPSLTRFPDKFVYLKKAFLIRNHIALWDVIGSCDIDGSSDSSIRNVKDNDISKILTTADIKAIYLNGKKAYHLYQKYMQPVIQREGICLPSTSPANAAWSPERLIKAWSIIRT